MTLFIARNLPAFYPHRRCLSFAPRATQNRTSLFKETGHVFKKACPVCVSCFGACQDRARFVQNRARFVQNRARFQNVSCFGWNRVLLWQTPKQCTFPVSCFGVLFWNKTGHDKTGHVPRVLFWRVLFWGLPQQNTMWNAWFVSRECVSK